VLESNRDLVLRRLVECLGRDRTRHQVAEVTSLGLVQMTRKRIGTGLLEAFSHDCEHCKGRGVVVQDQPVVDGNKSEDDEPRGRRSRGGRNRGRTGNDSGDNGNGNGNGGNGHNGNGNGGSQAAPSPADLARSRPPEKSDDDVAEDQVEDLPAAEDEGPDKPVIGTPSVTPPEPQEVPSSQAETAAEPEPEPVETSPEPRVVTSTRRRTARRPAGPPAAASDPSPEPVAVPVEPAVPGHGPDDEDQDLEQEDDGEGGFSLVHVPIKRKGSRKR
jgi:ribonuclease E